MLLFTPFHVVLRSDSPLKTNCTSEDNDLRRSFSRLNEAGAKSPIWPVFFPPPLSRSSASTGQIDGRTRAPPWASQLHIYDISRLRLPRSDGEPSQYLLYITRSHRINLFFLCALNIVRALYCTLAVN